MSLYTELPAGAQVAYSELYEVAQQLELHRSIASLRGSVHFKIVTGGKSYAYFIFQDVLTGRQQQLYLGPDSEKLRELAVRARESAPAGAVLKRQAGAAVSHGCASLIPKHYRIIRQLADAQFFRAGGLLIGSHAFTALGNMLGVRWSGGTHTLDIDFAHSGPRGNISVALPANLSINIHGAIQALEMGFLPTQSLRGGGTNSYANPAEPDLRLDFLTPARRDGAPIYDPNLKIDLQPLKFLDYLLEDSVQTVILHTQGAVVVNVPAPARFALHKLVVATKRTVTERAKSAKDRRQAASMLAYLMDQSRQDLIRAWEDLNSRGAGWSDPVATSIEWFAAQEDQDLRDMKPRLDQFQAALDS